MLAGVKILLVPLNTDNRTGFDQPPSDAEELWAIVVGLETVDHSQAGLGDQAGIVNEECIEL